MAELDRWADVLVECNLARNAGAIGAEDRAEARRAGRGVTRGRVFDAGMQESHRGNALAQQRLKRVFELVLANKIGRAHV